MVLKTDECARFIGWVWMQPAFLVNSLNHGWIAFVSDQTEENLIICPMCKRPKAGAK